MAEIQETRASLGAPADRTTAGFRAFAQANDHAVSEADGALTVEFQNGMVSVSPDGPRTALVIRAETPVAMQLLRDAMAARISGFGIPLTWEKKLAPGRPANLSIARVAEVARLTPSYTRVVLEGPDLARFAKGDLHFRLLFGPPGADWPRTDDGGVTQWPGGVEAWHRPAYTTRAIRPRPDGSASIDLDVFLHAGGRVTEWTRTLRPGAEIALTGPGGGRGAGDAAWVGLIGDETAFPVIARILSDLAPATTGQATVFVAEEGDRQDLARPEGVTLDWVIRGQGSLPTDVLATMEFPETDRFIFFAAEGAEALWARDNLLSRGLGKGEFRASTYWTKPG